MGQATLAADRIHHLNIGLMLVSCAVALFIPFELFLFAYAVLGPAHYLTEISWLQQRKFFTPGRYDFLVFPALAVAVFFGPPPVNEHYTVTQAVCTAMALGMALVFVLTRKTGPRLAGVAAAIALALLLSQVSYTALFLAMFVPTVVHVYLFTGFFMIYGALKERNLNGYVAFGVFLACPLLCWFLDPAHYEPRPYVAVSYWKNFSLLNLSLLGVPVPHTRDEGVAAGSAVFVSTMGWRVMRFIAFAYTYHYLNWFSKTSVIRWHEVGKKRLAVVAALWIAAVGTYAYDYSIGFRVLFCLSFLHIYLEFPLNHISIMGTYRELRSRLGAPRPASMGA